MKLFSGFPARSRFVPLPEDFFVSLLPDITDLYEMKVTLYLLRVFYIKRGYPRFLTLAEMEADRVLLALASGAEGLRRALSQAVGRGTLLQIDIRQDGREHHLYLLNDEPSRKAIDQIRKDQLRLGEIVIEPPPLQEARDIFTLYEQNIGLLTPMVAEELKDAEKQYPTSWIEDAFKEAVAQNKRRWRYIARILERWASEGREDGTAGRHPKEDPDKYIKGRYGHIVRR